MNAIQYYIIDGFIKNKNPSDHEPTPSEDGEADEDGETRADHQEEHDGETSVDGEDEAETMKKPSSRKATKLKVDQKKLDEYNPDLDGETTPTAVASESSSQGEQEGQALLDKKGPGEDMKKS